MARNKGFNPDWRRWGIILLKAVSICAVVFLAICSILLLVAVIRSLLLKAKPSTILHALEGRDIDMIDESEAMVRALRLAGALKIRTISHGVGDLELVEHLKMHDYLEKSFPLIHNASYITREVVNGYSLLYTVQGTVNGTLPYLLASHMDVVPVNEASWEVPPFAGIIVNDTYIYGRGALDVKCGVMGIMEGLEYMLKSGKRPMRTFYIAFGHDEEVSPNTVQRCVRQRNQGEPFETPGRIRRMKKLVTGIDGFTQDVIARCIYKNHELGKHITLQKLLVDVKETGEFSGSRSSLHRIVKEMGFKWKKSDSKLTLMETPYITQKRLTFLRSYIRNQESDKPRTTVFLDETWIYLNGSLAVRTWTQDSNLKTVTKRPQGEGKRFIVLHAGTKFGFVPNCSLLFVSKSASGDYHGEMNGDNFKKWVTDQLLPGLRELNQGPYLIVMDNASYHSVQVEKQPTTAWNMKTLSAWLEKHGIATPPNPSKKELQILALQNRSILKRYVIDELIETDTTVDCQVLRLPPYHCQYNPIELVWSQAKSFYNKNVIGACVEETSRDKRTLQVWKEALSQVTPERWASCIKHSEKLVQQAWEAEVVNDRDDTEPIIINLQDCSSSEDDPDDLSDISDLDSSASTLDHTLDSSFDPNIPSTSKALP